MIQSNPQCSTRTKSPIHTSKIHQQAYTQKTGHCSKHKSVHYNLQQSSSTQIQTTISALLSTAIVSPSPLPPYSSPPPSCFLWFHQFHLLFPCLCNACYQFDLYTPHWYTQFWLMLFWDYDKVGIELDKVSITDNYKIREGQGGMCMEHAHDITKSHRKEKRGTGMYKEDSWESFKRHNWA